MAEIFVVGSACGFPVSGRGHSSLLLSVLGRSVLIGTRSVEKSEYLSKLLTQAGIEHQVLNARQHEREAQIVAMAGAGEGGGSLAGVLVFAVTWWYTRRWPERRRAISLAAAP